jgi:predicted ester cyclase
MDAAEVVALMHSRLLESRDPTAAEDLFAPEFVSHNMPPGFPAGFPGVRRFFELFSAAFPDVEVTIDELVADGDRAAVATTMTGTHTGELMGIAPTGRRVSVTGIDVVRVEDGRIVEHRGLTDTVGLMRQLAS